MAAALLVEYFRKLPEPRRGESAKQTRNRFEAALRHFKDKVAARYTEGTLQRVLRSPDFRARRAAVLALNVLGTMDSNAHLAARLHDEDEVVRRMAGEALWAVWFRGDIPENNAELQRLTRLTDAEEALAGLDALIERAPLFAEAYNQRAIVHFRRKQYQLSVADCERVLRLNPYHFGAQGGMAQCFMHLRKPKAALKAFRQAYRINPSLEGVEETIRELEEALGEEGKK